MKELISYISQFGSLNTPGVELIISKATEVNLRKGEYFSKAGRIPKQVGFITEGVIRGYYHDSLGDEITRCIISENSIVVDYINFEANTFSSESLQACTDCKLVVFSKNDWDDFSQSIAGWDNIKNKMVQICMYQKSRKGPVISQDAATRYIDFLEHYPMLINRIPLAYIASYLGITPQSLSRIRRAIR